MKFCRFCGEQVSEASKFCSSCGKSLVKKAASPSVIPLTGTHTAETPAPSRQAPVQQRHISADSTVCPFCGCGLSSLSATCPACGAEIKGRKANSACQELLMLLDEIERNKPVPRESSTFSKFLSGASQITGKFDYEDPEDKERERIEEETLEKKARAIKNFIIPNNKEDILEFLMFSRSKFPGNYEGIIRELDDYVINEEDWENEYYLLGAAWVRKYLEAYEKATIFLPTDPDFIRLRKEREAVEEKIAQEEEEKRIRKENRLSAKLARKIKNSISEKLD